MRELINLNDMLKWDSTILDDYVLPDTITIPTDNPDEPVYSMTLDHDTMSSNIVMILGTSHPRFNEPDVFKNALNLWFLTHRWNIEHLMRVACQNYNPLENYDRWEHLHGTNTLGGTDTEVHSGLDITTTSNNETETHSGSDITTSSNNETETHSGTDTTEDTTSAMNASTYQPSDKSTLTHGETIQTNNSGNVNLSHGETIQTNSSGNVNLSHGENINTNYGKTDTNVDNNHIHGNIGVTTFTQMAQAEISLSASFNIYQNIVSLIENDLFICVY